MTEPPRPPARHEPPPKVLVTRWLALGCAATLAVLVAAFLAFGWFVVDRVLR